ncbi:MAG: spermidine synthase [Deltaproteobacteria bacterium]|nr:spermidine synthase [Deltaproteobacteria bacterium]
MRPWQTLEKVGTPAGPLELRQRGEKDFLITIDGRVLMTSTAHRSEDALAIAACEAIAGTVKPRVLLGGLGMGFTLRAALDHLPGDATVDVVELNQAVVSWCQGPLAVLSDNALSDRRVNVIVKDVAHVIARAPAGHYQAIIIDLYEGPHDAVNGPRDPLYGTTAIAMAWNALKPKGIFAVWSEEPDKPFENRMGVGGFELQRVRAGQGGRIHFVYLGTRLLRPPRPPRPPHEPARKDTGGKRPPPRGRR